MTRTCERPGCDRRHYGLGLCAAHYQRARHGIPLDHRLLMKGFSVAERILERVEFDPFGGCWLWPGTVTNGGYGLISISGKLHLVHREAWKAFRGPIPEGGGYHGTCVLHRCDVRPCANPDHLFLGDHSVNMLDRSAKGRFRNQWSH